MNSQYTFEPAYLTCLANHMHDSKPFGDVPLKMASSVKRSMVATRTLIRALRSGHAIAENVKKVNKQTAVQFRRNDARPKIIQMQLSFKM